MQKIKGQSEHKWHNKTQILFPSWQNLYVIEINKVNVYIFNPVLWLVRKIKKIVHTKAAAFFTFIIICSHTPNCSLRVIIIYCVIVIVFISENYYSNNQK